MATAILGSTGRNIVYDNPDSNCLIAGHLVVTQLKINAKTIFVMPDVIIIAEKIDLRATESIISLGSIFSNEFDAISGSRLIKISFLRAILAPETLSHLTYSFNRNL